MIFFILIVVCDQTLNLFNRLTNIDTITSIWILSWLNYPYIFSRFGRGLSTFVWGAFTLIIWLLQLLLLTIAIASRVFVILLLIYWMFHFTSFLSWLKVIELFKFLFLLSEIFNEFDKLAICYTILNVKCNRNSVKDIFSYCFVVVLQIYKHCFLVANVEVVLHSIVYFATRHLIHSWVWYFSYDFWTLFGYSYLTRCGDIVCRSFFFVVYLFRRFRFYHLLFLLKCLYIVVFTLF